MTFTDFGGSDDNSTTGFTAVPQRPCNRRRVRRTGRILRYQRVLVPFSIPARAHTGRRTRFTGVFRRDADRAKRIKHTQQPELSASNDAESSD